jgi:hypothetical protein
MNLVTNRESRDFCWENQTQENENDWKHKLHQDIELLNSKKTKIENGVNQKQ